jgi:hypothetical protein
MNIFINYIIIVIEFYITIINLIVIYFHLHHINNFHPHPLNIPMHQLYTFITIIIIIVIIHLHEILYYFDVLNLLLRVANHED